MTIPEGQVPKAQGSFHFRLFQVFLHLLLICHLTELLPGLYKGFKSVGDFTALKSVSKVSLQGEDTTVTIHHGKISHRDFWTYFFPFCLSRVFFGWPCSLTCPPSSLLSVMSLRFKRICLSSSMCLVPHTSLLSVCCSLLPTPSSHQNRVFLFLFF